MATKRTTEQTPGPPGAETLEQVFRCNAALYGFDIWSFDEWLAAMDDCGAKRELIERRQLAREAIQIGAINTDALLRHLEWMLLRWKYIRRTDYLMPLARTGRGVKAGGTKGAEASRQTRRGPNSKRTAILKESKAYTGSEDARVATVARRIGATPKYVREVLKNPNP